MSENCTFIGAYDGECDDESIRGAAGGADAENCIGLAVMQEGFFKYMYLCDLKVSAAARGRGIGMKLIERAKELAREKGYRGIYVIAQDNNLGACLFYLKCGFRIGGFDTEVYRGTAQEGKSDINLLPRLLSRTARQYNGANTANTKTLHPKKDAACFVIQSDSVEAQNKIRRGIRIAERQGKAYLPAVATITALMVCIRFSASSNTLEQGARKTSSVTSCSATPYFS